ncbi:hypothetical protein Dsin_027896 [Dipteronia sinensis]|uniref:Uncharacterized protein n=1 Tax=Dipteronia sinensis TaxID=43782 RepID=A0AAE0DTX0_9ROSI|nr:hypothetical protein Dsin_027896 [Dipteronia sinensis]
MDTSGNNQALEKPVKKGSRYAWSKVEKESLLTILENTVKDEACCDTCSFKV